MFIPRALSQPFERLLRGFPIVSVTGPRQAGKTTFLKKQLPGWRYVTLEDLKNRQFALEDPTGFLKAYPEHTIIDEAQRAPELFSYLQGKVDETGESGQYILSGSQNFLLLESITQSLAGRVGILRLLPCSFAELKSADLEPASMEEAIFRGGYPRIFSTGLSPQDYFQSYLETYIERDVRAVLNIRNLDQFALLVRLCAGRAGQVLNYTALSNEVGATLATVKTWMAVLEASYVIYRLQPFHTNLRKRLTGTPKLYFYDTGLLCWLLDIANENQVGHHFAKGQLLENWVIGEVMKHFTNQGRRPQLYFHREAKGNEVDLVMEQGQAIKALEIKWASTFSRNFTKGLDIFVQDMAPVQVDSWIVAGNHEHQLRSRFTLTGWQSLNRFLESLDG